MKADEKIALIEHRISKAIAAIIVKCGMICLLLQRSVSDDRKWGILTVEGFGLLRSEDSKELNTIHAQV